MNFTPYTLLIINKFFYNFNNKFIDFVNKFYKKTYRTLTTLYHTVYSN